MVRDIAEKVISKEPCLPNATCIECSTSFFPTSFQTKAYYATESSFPAKCLLKQNRNDALWHAFFRPSP